MSSRKRESSDEGEVGEVQPARKRSRSERGSRWLRGARWREERECAMVVGQVGFGVRG